jgi:uncharacterized glyoxalase superfamily protein PhnB
MTSTPDPSPQPPPPTVWPTFRAHDARALIDFLVRAFGFVETASFGQGDRVDHAQLAWPEGGGVMLGSERDDGVQVTGPGSFSCYVVCSDPEALHARALAAGAECHQGLTDTDYGSRDVGFRDPEGNAWHFGTYRGEPVPR